MESAKLKKRSIMRWRVRFLKVHLAAFDKREQLWIFNAELQKMLSQSFEWNKLQQMLACDLA